MSAAKAWAAFDWWYERSGHWMYPAKSFAEKAWAKHGIEGLPDYPGPRA